MEPGFQGSLRALDCRIDGYAVQATSYHGRPTSSSLQEPICHHKKFNLDPMAPPAPREKNANYPRGPGES